MQTENSYVNVDPKEVAKFSELAHGWWDPSGAFKLLHLFNPLRLGWMCQHIDLEGKQVLDVGCGGGILSESMARAGAIVKGIDLSSNALKVAKLHGLESGVRVDYQEMAVEALAQQAPAQFDAVTCLEMLEHVPDPASVINACAQLLKPGGVLFLSTINRTLKAYLLAVVGAEYVLNLLERGTHDYAKFLRPAELGRYARGAGLDVGQVVGVDYNPLTEHFKMTSSPDVNYMMVCKKK